METPQGGPEPPLHSVEVVPVLIGHQIALGFRVDLPRTRLIAISTGQGYIMCGALDVALLDERLGNRRVVAGRALGVRSIADLLEQPLTDVTEAARERGVQPGMTGREALLRMF